MILQELCNCKKNRLWWRKVSLHTGGWGMRCQIKRLKCILSSTVPSTTNTPAEARTWIT